MSTDLDSRVTDFGCWIGALSVDRNCELFDHVEHRVCEVWSKAGSTLNSTFTRPYTFSLNTHTKHFFLLGGIRKVSESRSVEC